MAGGTSNAGWGSGSSVPYNLKFNDRKPGVVMFNDVPVSRIIYNGVNLVYICLKPPYLTTRTSTSSPGIVIQNDNPFKVTFCISYYDRVQQREVQRFRYYWVF